MIKPEYTHDIAQYIQYVHNLTGDWLKAELEGRRYARFNYGKDLEEGELRYAFNVAKELPAQEDCLK